MFSMFDITICRASLPRVPLAKRRHVAGRSVGTRWCTSRTRQPRVVAAEAETNNEEASREGASQPQAEPDGPGGEGSGGKDDIINLQLPPEVIRRIKEYCFSFDTFFVTSTENYQADGVLFKGNLRGPDPAVAFEKMERRLHDQLGDAYKVYLLKDQEEKPVVVILPASAVVTPQGALPLSAVAAVTAGITLITTLAANGVPVVSATLAGEPGTALNSDLLSGAVPGTLALFAILGAHELGHTLAARKAGVQLRAPVFIPAGLGIIGSFGAITAFKGTLRDRQQLLRVAAAGPASGAAVSLAVVVLGLLLSMNQLGPLVELQSKAFNDSILMGTLGKLAFGQSLGFQDSMQISPVLLAGWAGLVINSLNVIPVGELDGGRIVHAIWGRRAATRVGVVSTLALGLTAFLDDISLYWILFVLIAQRGPISPQSNEVSAPCEPLLVNLSAALLFLPLLTLLPFPGDLTQASGF